MTKRHISEIHDGERLRLNLNYYVSRIQFDSDTEHVNVVDATCKVKDNGEKIFITPDGKEHNPKDFQFDYKGYFYKNENDIVLSIYD